MSPAVLADPQVEVTTVEIRGDFARCENCDEPGGRIGIYWHATEAPTGSRYVCDDPRCLNWALRDALEDSPTDTPVQVEYEVHPASDIHPAPAVLLENAA